MSPEGDVGRIVIFWPHPRPLSLGRGEFRIAFVVVANKNYLLMMID
jgi:hypothetical protein